jgi:hypothetical protein
MDEDNKKALMERHRLINTSHDWWDSVYDDFRQICEIIGIDLDKGEPSFTGFWSQGDGASFTGQYRAWDYLARPPTLYYETAPTKIREHAPNDEELHRIADELCMLSRIYFPTFINTKRFGSSSYVHEQTMDCYVEPMEGDPDDWAEEVHAHVQDQGAMLMRDLARWLYRTLEAEYDYLTSDEAVWEAIQANELCGAHNK